MADIQAKRLDEIDELLRECQRHGMSRISVSYAQLMAMRAETIEATTALDALERMARDGRGPTLSQKSVHTHAAHYGIGTTRDDFCAAIVALDKATRGKECS